MPALLAAFAAAAFAAPAPAAAPSLRPFDYIGLADRLSQPVFPETNRTEQRVAMPDGEELYIEVVRPDPEVHGNGPWPVIMEASPYHGTLADRSGTRIFPDPENDEGEKLGLTGYFAPRGYAVVMVDLRGTGRSSGCLDHIGPNDASDLKTIIEWAARAAWSNGRVGLTGHSYVGSTPAAAAAMDPEGLVTIAPSAGLAAMYDHQFNRGVPWLLQWAGPMFAYEGLALDRDLPPGLVDPVSGAPTGDNFDNAPNPQAGCGLPNSSLTAGTGQVTGQYEAWHRARDWREGATGADIPIFMIHGVNDNAARIPAAEWFFGERFMRPGDKTWIGQWDHGSTNGRCGDREGERALHPTCRFDQFQYALHAWFDHYLMQRRVPTGPAVEAFLNGAAPIDVTQIVDPETLDAPVYATNGWREPEARLALYPDASAPGPADSDGALAFEPPSEDASASFGTIAEAVLVGVGRGRLTFTSEPLARDTLLLGLPEPQLNASLTTGQITHLTTTLFRERVTTGEDGEEVVEREPMSFCAIQPQLRNGIEAVTPVVPGEEMALEPQCFTMAHWVPAGQRLALEVSTKTPHHATFASSDQQITVFTGPEATRYELPLVERFRLFDDVSLYEDELEPIPVGPAQPGIEGEVLVPAPGAGVIVEPVTAAAFEFDSEEGFDNASFEAIATPSLPPADLDLYLQRQVDDGWEDVTAAETGDLEREVLTAGRLGPGRYRIVVHNWLGAPQQVSLKLTFFNGAGEPGEDTGGTGTATEAQLQFGNGSGLLQP
ncbi:MAG: CocE/NonD family hydrolase [Solirubrobacterales bacterium]